MDYKEIMRNSLYKNSGIPAYYLNKEIKLIPTKDDKDAFRLLKSIENGCSVFLGDGCSLNIYSSTVGNGKTSWAVKIAKRFIDTYACEYSNVDVVFINVPEFIALKKRSFDNTQLANEFAELYNRILNAKVVIFDDIATKQSTDFDTEFLYVIINTRINNMLSSIYTSNVQPDEMKKLLGERIADRILGAPMSLTVELKGKSMRGLSF